MALNILRAEHSAQYPFVMMSKETANNGKLSFGARGMLNWLLDKPDTWNVDPDAIARLNETSVYEVKKLLNELVREGYLIPPQRQRVKGKFQYSPYILRETPGIMVESFPEPLVEIREAETVERKPLNGNRDTETNQRSRTEVKHAIAAGAITKINNINKQEQEIKTDKTLLANPELVAPAPALVEGSSVYVIPALLEVDLWEKSALTMPAEIEQAERDKAAVKAKEPEIAPAAQPEPAKGATSNAPNPPVRRVPLPPPDESDLIFDRVLARYEEFTGQKTSPDEQVLIQRSVDKYSEDWLTSAIEVAEEKNKPFWGFIAGVLTRWKNQGGKDMGKSKPAVKPTENYDQYLHPDDQPVPEPVPLPPVDQNWQDLGFAVERRSTEIYRSYFRRCKFDGVENGVLKVLAPDERTLGGCQREMNFRGLFFKAAELIWQGLTAVRFDLEEIPDAHPETG